MLIVLIFHRPPFNGEIMSTKHVPVRYIECRVKQENKVIDMKKLTYTTAIFMAMVATSVFAHHPSEGMNPNYETVDAQLIEVESPHLEMDLDAMGATTAAGDSDTSTETRDQAGWQSNQVQAGGAFDADPPTDAAAAADTIDLLENVAE